MADETEDEYTGPDMAGVSTLPEGEPVDSGQPTETVETTPDVTAERPSWVDSLGDDFKGLDEKTAFERINEFRSKAAEAEQLRQANQQAQWAYWQAQREAEQLRQQQAQIQQATQRQQAEQGQTAKPKREVPPYDPSWLNLVTKDEKGQWIAVPGAQPDLPQKLAAYAAWKDAEQAKFLTDPAAYFQEVAGDQIRQLAAETVQHHMQQMQFEAAKQREISALTQFQNKNAALFYEDPQTMTRPTGIGMEWLRRSQGYMQQGVRSPSQAAEFALRDMFADAQISEFQRSQGTNGKTPQENFLRKTAAKAIEKKPNRDGGKAAEALPKGRFSFGDMYKKRLAESGIPTE